MVIKALGVDEITQRVTLMTLREAARGKNPEKHQQRWTEAEKPAKVNENITGKSQF